MPKPSETEVKPEVKTEFKTKLEPKTEVKSPEGRKGPGRPPKRKRPEKKEDEEVSKKARDQIEKDHGWMVLGESSRRPILKPGESSYADRLCYEAIQSSRTGQKISRRDSVVIFAGDQSPPFYAIINDFYKDQYGSLMAWIYWYYRREDVDAPNSLYVAGEDELIASRHHDSISVATILTTFKLLTYNQYCRFKARESLKNSTYFPTESQCLKIIDSASESDSEIQPPQVFFCRRFYDNSQRSICVRPSFLRSVEVQSSKDSQIKLRPR